MIVYISKNIDKFQKKNKLNIKYNKNDMIIIFIFILSLVLYL